MDFKGDGAYSSVYKVKRQEDDLPYALKKVKMLNLSDKEKENALTLVACEKKFVIPYGTCTLNKEGSLDQIEEKRRVLLL